MMHRERALMAGALRDALRPRRLLATLLLIGLPAALGVLWRVFTPAADFVPEDAYDRLVPSLIFSFALTILAVIYGTGVLSQEIEQKTIVYLLTRPVPRWRLLLSRFAAALLVIGVTVTLSALLLALVLFGPGGLAAAGVGRDLRALLIGVLAYASLFLMIATLLPRPLTYGLLFVFGWETWVPSLPGAFARLSVMSYLRALAPHEAAVESAGGGFLQAFNPPKAIPPAQAWWTLVLIAAVSLAVSLVVFSLREYAPRDDVE